MYPATPAAHPEDAAQPVPTPYPPSRHRRAGRRRDARQLPLAAATAVTLGWLAVVLVAPHIEVGAGLHRLALFGHLAALVVGFGAVLTMDWFGLLWMLRRIELGTLVRIAHEAHLLIWLGLFGLVASGSLLGPDTSAPLTRVKLLAVLAVALNGLYVGRLRHRLAGYAGGTAPWRLLALGALAALTSQAAWWTATAVGFLTTQH